MTLDEALNQFREEFPLFFNFCKKVQEGKLSNIVQNVTYYSYDFDIYGRSVCYSFIHVNDKEITAVGEERFRDGGIYWNK